MSNQQENTDTGSVSSSASCEQAEPTPGPWECSPQDGPPGHCINAQVWDEDGDCVAAIDSLPNVGEANANARLIAAAGTAAQEAKEMGYDPVDAVEALPELLDSLGALAEINSKWSSAESDDITDMPEEDHKQIERHMEALLQGVNALAKAEREA